MPRDPVKAAERKRRYRLKQKIAKFGVENADRNMQGRHGNHARGADNPRWNNGTMRTSQGYIAVKVSDDHHLRQPHGYAYEHQLVAEAKLGRRLTDNECVHHINGRRDDNRPENIEILSRSGHASEHARMTPRAADGTFLPGEVGSRVQEFPHV